MFDCFFQKKNIFFSQLPLAFSSKSKVLRHSMIFNILTHFTHFKTCFIETLRMLARIKVFDYDCQFFFLLKLCGNESKKWWWDFSMFQSVFLLDRISCSDSRSESTVVFFLDSTPSNFSCVAWWQTKTATAVLAQGPSSCVIKTHHEQITNLKNDISMNLFKCFSLKSCKPDFLYNWTIPIIGQTFNL